MTRSRPALSLTAILGLLAALTVPGTAEAQRTKGVRKQSRSQKAPSKLRARQRTRPVKPSSTRPRGRRGASLSRRLRTRNRGDARSRLLLRRNQKRAASPSPALERKLSHPFNPMVAGMKQTYRISVNGKPQSRMTQEVTRTMAEGKTLHAEVRTSVGPSSWTTAHRTRDGEVLAVQSEKIGGQPNPRVTQNGVVMPRTLRVGTSWKETTSFEGSTRAVESKVVKAITARGPGGKQRKGFEIVQTDRSTIQSTGTTSTHTTRYRVLEGVGMVWSQRRSPNGDVMTHELVDFR